MDISLLGFQAYRNLCSSSNTESFLQKVFVEQNKMKHRTFSVSMSSIGADSRRFCNQRLTARCSSGHDHDLSPSRTSKFAGIITKITPRWQWHKDSLRNTLVGLCFIVCTVIFGKYLAFRNMTDSERSRFLISSASRMETILSGVGDTDWYDVQRYDHKDILPPTHPTHIHLESKLVEMINALNMVLKFENDKRMTVSSNAKEEDNFARTSDDHQLMLREEFNKIIHIYNPSLLEGRKWKLVVVYPDDFDHGLYRSGPDEIVLNARAMEWFCHSEEQVAAFIGHQV